MQEQIIQWLRSCPGLEKLTEEWIGELPGCAGLFYQGERELSSTAYITGHRIRRIKATWKLVTNTEQPVSVALARAPILGLMQAIRMEKMHLSQLGEMQLPRWEAEIGVEFTTVPDGPGI